jgi:Icc-related predicted phosphoesterase
MVRICATSDFHGHLPDIPECDLLIIAGDICPMDDHRDFAQSMWMRGPFSEWLENVYSTSGCREIIGISGNHDFLGDKVFVKGMDGDKILRGLNWVYLMDEMHEFEGLKIWGCPHTKQFFNWAFMMDPHALEIHHLAIPKETDIVVTHGPPFGFGDMVPRTRKRKDVEFLSYERVGSPGLFKWIIDNDPSLVVGGHIHCDQQTRTIGDTIVANVSYVDEHMRPYLPPQVFEINVPSTKDASSA